MTRRQAFWFGLKRGLKNGFKLVLGIAIAPFAAMRSFVRHDLPMHHR